MSRITNPCNWFRTGGSWNDKVYFTYEGGSTLYHFCPGREIDEFVFHCWIPINLIFFADNKEHAANVIERMLKLRIEALKTYEEKEGKCYYIGDQTRILPHLLLDNKDKWIISEAPTNQFYEVGWADNDNIL